MNKRIVVAMSGGVDSSVAAALLKSQGHEVIGISMSLSETPSDVERSGGCCSLDDISDARKVSEQLEIPFYVLNLKRPFKEKVVNSFISEYLSGRTPNPCILCNQILKFDILLKKALELDADLLATGHYARILFDAVSGRYQLLKGIDQHKDQSYFLFTMTQAQLEKVIFPVGELSKEEVRRLAVKFGLKVADKKDSQEICFVTDDDYSDFISKTALKSITEGDIIDTSGKIVGRHQGIHNFTIGQRKGLRLTSPRLLYVVALDVAKNQVIVGEEDCLYSKRLIAEKVNWLSIPEPSGEIEAVVKVRYRHDGEEAIIEPGRSGNVVVEFKRPVKSVTPGQAVVFYKGDAVLGGGWIA